MELHKINTDKIRFIISQVQSTFNYLIVARILFMQSLLTIAILKVDIFFQNFISYPFLKD